MLRILYVEFDQKVKNIHDEMDLHHSYKKKRVFLINNIYINKKTFIRPTLKSCLFPVDRMAKNNSTRYIRYFRNKVAYQPRTGVYLHPT